MSRRRSLLIAVLVAIPLFAARALLPFAGPEASLARADEATDIDPAAVKRAGNTVKMLDNIFKQTVVLITDKYVHDEEDFAAGSAAVLLFKNVSDSGPVKVRLIDLTGEPYDEENVAADAFEKAAAKKLKAGAAEHQQVLRSDGKPVLRALTAVPVVSKKCVMCHPHYADAKKNEAIGAISYLVPIE